jgi:hypothetical protein
MVASTESRPRRADYSTKCSHFVERRVFSWPSKQAVTSSLESLVKRWRRGGIATVVAEEEVRVGGLVSVGRSLVFNAPLRLEGIVSVYASSNDPQIARN